MPASGPAATPGERIRYAPPFGVAFAAWDTDEEQRAWIARSGATNPVLARRLEEVLARTRQRGFDVDCTTPGVDPGRPGDGNAAQ